MTLTKEQNEKIESIEDLYLASNKSLCHDEMMLIGIIRDLESELKVIRVLMEKEIAARKGK